MTVNSFSFLIFFIVVFSVYYLPGFRNSHKLQNFWLLLVSYFFYGYVDLRMTALLLGFTILFYLLGLLLHREIRREHWRQAGLITSLGAFLGVGILFYFKYLGFFASQFALFLTQMGFDVSWGFLHIIMPLGVSFFTFKLISYLIEIHREKIVATTDFVEFGVYISFFPTILSGPIDRANTFIPQLRRSRPFDYGLAVDGCRQILWGMFTKMCIADRLAIMSDRIWSDIPGMDASTLLMGALLYPVQLYADFDGYSNMAIGVGKLLGLHVQKNFNHPFLARNIAEYWREWHISLTTWLTDYVFTPLNMKFRNLGKLGVCLAIVINFVLVGFWHGPNWTYGVFGLYHGLLFIPLIYLKIFNRRKKLKANKYKLPKFKEFVAMCATYILVAFGLIIFRAPSLGAFADYLTSMFDPAVINVGHGLMTVKNNLHLGYETFLFIASVMCIEWFTRNKEFGLQLSGNTLVARSVFLRYMIYIILIIMIFFYRGEDSPFIYFQF